MGETTGKLVTERPTEPLNSVSNSVVAVGQRYDRLQAKEIAQLSSCAGREPKLAWDGDHCMSNEHARGWSSHPLRAGDGTLQGSDPLSAGYGSSARRGRSRGTSA